MSLSQTVKKKKKKLDLIHEGLIPTWGPQLIPTGLNKRTSGGSAQPEDLMAILSCFDRGAEVLFLACLLVCTIVVLNVEEMLMEHNSRVMVQGDEVMWLLGDH